MLEKIKLYISNVRDFIIYILGPLIGIGAYIFYLRGQNEKLKDKLESAEFEKKDEELKHEQDQVDEQSTDAYRLYERLRYSYMSGSDSSSGPRDPRSKEADRDPGSSH